MDFLLKERLRLETAIENGHAISCREASLFPDIILRRNNIDVPDWFLPYLRQPHASSKARYVVADGKAFHVSMSSCGPIVSIASKYERNGVHKIVHDPYLDRDSTYLAAVAAYDLINSFVQDPKETLAKTAAPVNSMSPKPSRKATPVT